MNTLFCSKFCWLFLNLALNKFAAARDNARIKINTSETDWFSLFASRQSIIEQVMEKKRSKMQLSAAIRALHHSVVVNVSYREKQSYRHLNRYLFPSSLMVMTESWVMTESMRSQMQTSKIRFLTKIKSTMLDKVRTTTIRKSLNINLLLFRIERSQLRWFGYLSRMPKESLPKQTLSAKMNRKKQAVGRPRRHDFIKDLG